MSKLEKLKEKAKSLEARDPRSAIGAWLEILQAQEAEGDPNPDLSVFNRIGDLYLKVKDPAQAADYYDKAVDKYAESGLHNNAIAMCNKVLRNAPGRQTAYLKLAKLYAAKGFMAEAKHNFVAYAERMQKIGKIQQAFAALKEFTDISPQSAPLRAMLEEHLEMYGEEERHPPPSPPPPARTSSPTPVKPGGEARELPKGKSSSLVFLDLDEPATSRSRSGPQAAVPAAAPPSTPSPPSPPSPRRPEAEPVAETLLEPVTAEPDTSLAIEPTILAEGAEPTKEGGTLEGFETTSADLGSISLEDGEVASVREDLTVEDLGPVPELEPTVPADAESVELEVELEPLLEDEIEIEQPVPTKSRAGLPQVGRPPKAPAPPAVTPVQPKRPGAPPLTSPSRPGGGGGGRRPGSRFPGRRPRRSNRRMPYLPR